MTFHPSPPWHPPSSPPASAVVSPARTPSILGPSRKGSWDPRRTKGQTHTGVPHDTTSTGFPRNDNADRRRRPSTSTLVSGLQCAVGTRCRFVRPEIIGRFTTLSQRLGIFSELPFFSFVEIKYLFDFRRLSRSNSHSPMVNFYNM